jgi:GTPase SAR1 family protein
MEEYRKNIKIAVCGSEKVGKTFVCKILTNEEKDLEYNCTIGIEYLVGFFKDYNTKLCFWDFGGDKRLEVITYTYIHNIDLLLLIYNTHDNETIINLKRLYETYLTEGWKSKAILIGNNTDNNNSTENYIKHADEFSNDKKIPHVLVNCELNKGMTVLLEEIFKTQKIEKIPHKKSFFIKIISYCVNFWNYVFN